MKLNIDKPIKLETVDLTGGPIAKFEWKLDDVIQTDSTSSLIIPPKSLSLGDHTIKLKIENYCGNYYEVTKNITVVEVTPTMEYEQKLIVDKPTMNISIDLKRTSTITFTITVDGIPSKAAQVSVLDIISETDENGIATLSGVPYGDQVLKIKIIGE